MDDAAEEGILLRRYLLDDLATEEQARLEARYLEDEELFGRLRAAEDALIEDYHRGRLVPDARRRFETHYLASPVRRERAALLGSLIDYASRSAAAALPTAPPRSIHPRPVSRATVWTRAAALAAVAVATGLLARQWMSSHDSRWPAPPDQAASSAPTPDRDVPPRETPLRTPLAETLVWQRLVPGLTRSSSGGRPPTIMLGSGTTRLQLDLPRPGSGAYSLVLQTAEGREVWAGKGLPAEPVGTGWGLRVEIPRTALREGDYVLSVEAASDDPAAAAEYFFRVPRR